MNHITQKNRLEKQLDSYKKFMPLCPNDSLIKLIKEMTIIKARIDKIREFTIEELNDPVVYQFESKQSKLNFH